MEPQRGLLSPTPNWNFNRALWGVLSSDLDGNLTEFFLGGSPPSRPPRNNFYLEENDEKPRNRNHQQFPNYQNYRNQSSNTYPNIRTLVAGRLNLGCYRRRCTREEAGPRPCQKPPGGNKPSVRPSVVLVFTRRKGLATNICLTNFS